MNDDSISENIKTTIKLQAFLAHHSVASRRKAEELIAEGKIKVNGEIAHIGQRITPGTDTVEFEGASIGKPQQLRYFLAYKPRGVISTTSDELGRKNVIDLIPKQTERVFPVGRLDADSEGMIILTNDGELAHRLTHPSFKVEKTYVVTPDRRLSELALDHLRRGVKLKDGWAKPIAVEEVTDRDDGALTITLAEGRSHEIRRMLRRVGYEVQSLIRVQIGGLAIEVLSGAQWMELNAEQVKKLTE